MLDRLSAEHLTAADFKSHVAEFPVGVRIVLRILSKLKRGSLLMQLPEGRQFLITGKEDGPDAELVLHNWNLPYRATKSGTIGVAESYLDGDWDSPDVTTFLELFLHNTDMRSALGGVARLASIMIERVRHLTRSNTKIQAQRNIAAHYDLGNAFYEKWLDPSMTYSSAVFHTGANDLEQAQKAKYQALADSIGIKPGDHVLEIGCGWGGFAEYAASECGARVTGLTISREQLDYAQKRMSKAGLSDKVDLHFRDYRDETGKYDHIVSIEMLEAVGKRYWKTYFSKLRECLKPGGHAGLQAITICKEDYMKYRHSPDFIQRYIFPGGMLPTTEILDHVSHRAGLVLANHSSFAGDYARTLREWRERFWHAWPEIAPLGFDTRFKRLWEFYLHYCEAGFRAENIDVRQLVYRAA